MSEDTGTHTQHTRTQITQTEIHTHTKKSTNTMCTNTEMHKFMDKRASTQTTSTQAHKHTSTQAHKRTSTHAPWRSVTALMSPFALVSVGAEVTSTCWWSDYCSDYVCRVCLLAAFSTRLARGCLFAQRAALMLGLKASRRKVWCAERCPSKFLYFHNIQCRSLAQRIILQPQLKRRIMSKLCSAT